MTESLPPELPHNPNRIEPSAARARLSRKQILIMVLVVLIGGAALVMLKTTAKQENIAIQIAKKTEAETRVAQAAEINAALIKHYGGLSKKSDQRALVGRVGAAIRDKVDPKSTAPAMRFHLLNEANSINMFALSSGDIYVTTALLNRMQTEGQLAAVLAHAVAHVIAQDTPTAIYATEIATPVPLWRYTAQQERAADILGLKLMSNAGYDPTAMAGMLTVLAKAYTDGADVAFFTTHPNESARLNEIDATIQRLYPAGIPAVLSK